MEEKLDLIPQKIIDLLETDNDDNVLLACNLMGASQLYDKIIEIVSKPGYDPKWGAIRNKVAVVYVETALNSINDTTI